MAKARMIGSFKPSTIKADRKAKPFPKKKGKKK
jgi:hypothetical protein